MTYTLAADLYPDLLDVTPGVPWIGPVAMTWSPDGEDPYEARGSIVERIGSDRVLWYSPDPRIGTDNRATVFLYLPLDRPESREQIVRVLGRGLPCRNCAGVQPESCPFCQGTGHLRPPRDVRWALDALGTLPADLAHHSPALLWCEAMRAKNGLTPMRGFVKQITDDETTTWIGWWGPCESDRFTAFSSAGDALAHGFALLNEDGSITLPGVSK